MKTFLALLLLIPSLSWSKDLNGTKLFCQSNYECKKNGNLCALNYFIEFRKDEKVRLWEVSIYGIKNYEYNYEVKPSTIDINYTFLQQKITIQNGKNVKKIDRKNLMLSGGAHKKCKILKDENMNKVVDDFYHNNYSSKNIL